MHRSTKDWIIESPVPASGWDSSKTISSIFRLLQSVNAQITVARLKAPPAAQSTIRTCDPGVASFMNSAWRSSDLEDRLPRARGASVPPCSCRSLIFLPKEKENRFIASLILIIDLGIKAVSIHRFYPEIGAKTMYPCCPCAQYSVFYTNFPEMNHNPQKSHNFLSVRPSAAHAPYTAPKMPCRFAILPGASADTILLNKKHCHRPAISTISAHMRNGSAAPLKRLL